MNKYKKFKSFLSDYNIHLIKKRKLIKMILSEKDPIQRARLCLHYKNYQELIIDDSDSHIHIKENENMYTIIEYDDNKYKITILDDAIIKSYKYSKYDPTYMICDLCSEVDSIDTCLYLIEVYRSLLNGSLAQYRKKFNNRYEENSLQTNIKYIEKIFYEVNKRILDDKTDIYDIILFFISNHTNYSEDIVSFNTETFYFNYRYRNTIYRKELFLREKVYIWNTL